MPKVQGEATNLLLKLDILDRLQQKGSLDVLKDGMYPRSTFFTPFYPWCRSPRASLELKPAEKNSHT